MKLWNEFKEFAFTGNVLDMAVGVIIGGAFGKIVTSLVNDIFMPLLGSITGGMNFGDMKVVISPAEMDVAGQVIKPEAALMYGSFIQNIIDFILIAICIFVMVKMTNKLRRAKAVEEAPVAKGPTSEELLTEIRDLMKERKDS